jgi:hypothetical protein
MDIVLSVPIAEITRYCTIRYIFKGNSLRVSFECSIIDRNVPRILDMDSFIFIINDCVVMNPTPTSMIKADCYERIRYVIACDGGIGLLIKYSAHA